MLQRVGALGDRLRLAGQGRLAGAQVHALDDAPVGGDEVAHLEQHDVARHEFARGEFAHDAGAAHAHDGGGEFLECGKRALGAIVLRETECRVEQDDRQDRDRVGLLAEVGGDDTRDNQQHHHRAAQLLPQNAPRPAPARFDQLVGAVRESAPKDLSRVEAGARIDADFVQRRLRVPFVPANQVSFSRVRAGSYGMGLGVRGKGKGGAPGIAPESRRATCLRL